MFFTPTIVMGPFPNFPALLVWMRAMTAALSRWRTWTATDGWK